MIMFGIFKFGAGARTRVCESVCVARARRAILGEHVYSVDAFHVTIDPRCNVNVIDWIAVR